MSVGITGNPDRSRTNQNPRSVCHTIVVTILHNSTLANDVKNYDDAFIVTLVFKVKAFLFVLSPMHRCIPTVPQCGEGKAKTSRSTLPPLPPVCKLTPKMFSEYNLKIVFKGGGGLKDIIGTFGDCWHFITVMDIG